MALTHEVCVVGGGPAGCAAAITLARGGVDVTMIDRARFPREKACGDGLTSEALRLLEAFDVRPATLPSWAWIDDISIYTPGGRRTDLPLPVGACHFAAVVTRRELDDCLVQNARAAGVSVREGWSLRSASSHSDGVELEFESGHVINATYAIGADGARSSLARALALPHRRADADWHAVRQYLRVSTGYPSTMSVWYEPDLLPGYAWAFPLSGGLLNFGFGVLRPAGRQPPRSRPMLADLLARPQIATALGNDVTPVGPPRAWLIPPRFAVTHSPDGRVVFVGDACGAADPLTGEGISQALQTGQLAAAAILGAPSPDAVASRYDRALRLNLQSDNAMSRLLIRVVSRPTGLKRALRLVAANSWTQRNFARWLIEDYPRCVLFTPSRWHRHLFAPTGAFGPHH
jgi:geranylgeranyl reductase family protein